jgi:hypothetical protein
MPSFQLTVAVCAYSLNFDQYEEQMTVSERRNDSCVVLSLKSCLFYG